MKKYSAAWFARNRCYQYSKEELYVINEIMRTEGLSVNQAVELLLIQHPGVRREVMDTRRYSGPEVRTQSSFWEDIITQSQPIEKEWRPIRWLYRIGRGKGSSDSPESNTSTNKPKRLGLSTKSCTIVTPPSTTIASINED